MDGMIMHYGRREIPRVSRTSPSATNWASVALGEERHLRKKIDIWRHMWTEPFKKIFPECPALALGEGSLFPERPDLALGEGSLPWVPEKALGELIFFSFLPHFSFEDFLHYLKFLTQNWHNFQFFRYISLVFFILLNFLHTSILNSRCMK
jgi:hypothetical protein